MELGSEVDLLDRMMIAYRAARPQPVEDSPLRRQLMGLSECAALYFSGSYPGWSPKYLIKRILRKLAWPFLGFQVRFNRDLTQALLDLEAGSRDQSLSAVRVQETLIRVTELEQKVRRLSAQVEALSRLNGGNESSA